MSVDITPYPDLLKMLQDAEEATGADRTELILEALREQLPFIVKAMNNKRSTAFKLFVSRYEETKRDH